MLRHMAGPTHDPASLSAFPDGEERLVYARIEDAQAVVVLARGERHELAPSPDPKGAALRSPCSRSAAR